jgi:addiction module RelE/StbE family toxin
MRINYSKKFQKRFLKLDKKYREKVIDAIQVFQNDPFDSVLRNHPLRGSMLGKRSFSATGDMRIIFEEYENYTLVLMLDAGTHNQVY